MTYRGCLLGTSLRCGGLRDENECGDQVADGLDIYTLNDRRSSMLTFGGIGSVHPIQPGADGSEIWQLGALMFATEPNMLNGTGRFQNVNGSRSIRGYFTANGDGTFNIDQYHILDLYIEY